MAVEKDKQIKENRKKAIQIKKWKRQEAKRVAESKKRNTKRVTFDTIPEVLDEGSEEIISTPEPVQPPKRKSKVINAADQEDFYFQYL